MPKRLLLALIILVAAPLVLLGWLSRTTVESQQWAARKSIDDLFQNQLAQHDRVVTSLFDRYKREFSLAMESANQNPTLLQSLPQETPVARSVFIVDTKGNVLYPPPSSVTFEDNVIQNRPSISPFSVSNSYVVKKSRDSADSVATPTFAWQSWYMDEGMQLIFWESGPTSKLSLGVLLERSRWMSDLASALPNSKSAQVASGQSSSYRSSRSDAVRGFTALVDEQNRIVYRWGDNSERRAQPIATRYLPNPIANWRLEFHADDPLPKSSFLPTLLSLGGVGVLLLALGGYVLSSVRRRISDAQSRVSFASQVSHELRTPLTNIRLYAELAESDVAKLPENDTKSSIENRLSVIDCESKRLGRLVSGVLEVIREGGKQRPPQLTLLRPDDVIDQAIQQFQPSFDSAGVQIDRVAAAHERVPIDGDLLEMILVNLLGNVEKYAASGGYVAVHSSMSDQELIVTVSDRGPGIPDRHRRRIFQAFTRLDDSISAPSGTGIGLTIARKMAKRHRGSLELIDSADGASFELRLPTESVKPEPRELK